MSAPSSQRWLEPPSPGSGSPREGGGGAAAGHCPHGGAETNVSTIGLAANLSVQVHGPRPRLEPPPRATSFAHRLALVVQAPQRQVTMSIP